jgi:hypothetical protein
MARKAKELNTVEESDFQFFSESDFNKHGSVGNFMPSYLNPSLVDELKREISEEEMAINRQDLSPERRVILSNSVEKKKERLENITSNVPELDKDKINKASKELGKMISDAMFSRYDMRTGIADAHEEARRMSEPCIPVNGEIANILQGCNIRVDKDNPKVTRTQLEKAWKIVNRYLGENSNTERLRREK